jgi:bacteriocin biosynthesis cyclodehydratase domain-containing protein
MNDSKRLISASMILIRGEDMRSLLIKKGDREIILEFETIEDADRVVQILDKTKNPLSISQLLSAFSIDEQQEIEKIISRFLNLKLLIDYQESEISGIVLDRDFEQALDNFFWENEVSWPEFLQCKKNLSIKIIGINNMGILIAELLEKIGISDIQLIDYSYLKNRQIAEGKLKNLNIISFDQFLSLKNKNESLNIVADEFGNLPGLLDLNQIFLREKLTFLPLFILSQIGHVGPLVVPGKTSCFNCLLSRMELTYGKFNPLDASKTEYFEWQEHSSNHPSVIAALAHFFVFQFTSNIRFLAKGNTLSKNQHSCLIQNYCNMITELDLLTPQIFKRRVLRKPNCLHCRELMVRRKIVFDVAKEYKS